MPLNVKGGENSMKTEEELEKSIRKLEQELEELRKEQTKRQQEERKRKLEYIRSKEKHEVIVQKPDEHLWDTDEVFFIQIKTSVSKEDCPSLNEAEFKQLTKEQNYPKSSVLYLVSRRKKKIIGQCGGGFVMLRADMGIKDSWPGTEKETTDPRIKRLVETFLDSL
jgi:TolA-binding protein